MYVAPSQRLYLNGVYVADCMQHQVNACLYICIVVCMQHQVNCALYGPGEAHPQTMDVMDRVRMGHNGR
jgi:hypothetical protein